MEISSLRKSAEDGVPKIRDSILQSDGERLRISARSLCWRAHIIFKTRAHTSRHARPHIVSVARTRNDTGVNTCAHRITFLAAVFAEALVLL